MRLFILTGCCIILPGLAYLSTYRREWFRSDRIAGVVVFAVLLSNLALGGVSRICCHACIYPLQQFTSDHQWTRIDHAILLATTVAPLAMIDSARYAALAGAHALFSVSSICWPAGSGLSLYPISSRNLSLPGI